MDLVLVLVLDDRVVMGRVMGMFVRLEEEEEEVMAGKIFEEKNHFS